jgi:hypothetical protein
MHQETDPRILAPKARGARPTTCHRASTFAIQYSAPTLPTAPPESALRPRSKEMKPYDPMLDVHHVVAQELRRKLDLPGYA